MNFRTFYDRVEQNIHSYKEVNNAPSPVQPNLSLSIREIFDRWKKNMPLDLMTRNGSFMTEGTIDDEKDSDFDAYDIDNMDLAELAEIQDDIKARLDELAAVARQPAEIKPKEQSEIGVETPQAAAAADGSASHTEGESN